MAVKTQNILTTMYDLVTVNHGIHVQFQGDREFALFHNYAGYECLSDAVKAGLKMIDAVQTYGVSIGVGESFGKFYALQQLWIQRIILLSEYHMYGFLRRHHAHFRKPVQCQNVCSRDWQQL